MVMRSRLARLGLLIALLAPGGRAPVSAQVNAAPPEAPPPQAPAAPRQAPTLGGSPATLATTPVFRSNLNLVLVDAVVRDRSGAIVRGLTADDFQLFEDGKPQVIESFAFDEVSASAPAIVQLPMLGSVNAPGSRVFSPSATAATGQGATGAASPGVNAGVSATSPPLTPSDLAGHRLLVLLFDTSSMQPEDVQRAVDSARKWIAQTMTPADLVAVATIATRLDVLTDFTSDKAALTSLLDRFSGAEGTAMAAVDATTMSTDETTAAGGDDTTTDAGSQELDTFNNDVRLRALITLSEALRPIQQKKSILYFSSGMQRNGSDNQVELRRAVNTAVRANVSIYPVDARGLQAVVPGGDATQRSRGGVSAFSGQAMAQQFDNLQAQQETLQSLAADTGGTAFVDTNDFGPAFTKVTRDTSAYYILGFSSTNPTKDGRFRRITIRVKNRPGVKSDFKIEAREGYYADRDFAHTGKADREAQLQEQLGEPLPATDVPVFLQASYFRSERDRYYVPLLVAVPGAALPPSGAASTLDIAGYLRDERGAPVGQIRDTLTVPAAQAGGLASRQVVYQSGLTLPPGRFTARVVVRENTSGKMGTFEARLIVPDLKREKMKLSAVVVSTQQQKPNGRKTPSPLVREDHELVPSLTHILGRAQTLSVYFEVYDPAQANGAPALGTSLTFYRNGVKMFETPVVARDRIDAPQRHAVQFEFEVPASALKPGLYSCQVTVVDEVAAQFAFPRFELYVR